MEPEYSMLKRTIERELLPCYTRYQLGILPYFPLASKPGQNRLCWLSPLNKELPGVTADAVPTAQSIPAFAGVRLKVRP